MNESLNSSTTSAAEDTVSLLQESRVLFARATESSDLKQAARALREAREREQEVLKQGAKALIHALANSTDEEYEQLIKETKETEEACKRMQSELVSLQLESDAAAREQKLQEEIADLEEVEAEKQKQYQQAGGDAQLRRRQGAGGSKSAAVNMKRMLGLFHNITRVKWDLDCDEEDTVGAVVDDKENVIKQFRFGPIRDKNGDIDEFKLANKIWQSIG